MVGSATGGLPAPAVPTVTAHDVWTLLPPAAAVALIGVVETVAAIRTVEDTDDAVRRPGREAAALGAANVASGLLGGFAPMASASRSMSARSAGASSQLFQLGSAVLALIVLLTGGPAFTRLPLATLAAAVIVVTIPRMVDVGGFLRLWHGWRSEAVLALTTAAHVYRRAHAGDASSPWGRAPPAPPIVQRHRLPGGPEHQPTRFSGSAPG